MTIQASKAQALIDALAGFSKSAQNVLTDPTFSREEAIQLLVSFNELTPVVDKALTLLESDPNMISYLCRTCMMMDALYSAADAIYDMLHTPSEKVENSSAHGYSWIH